MADINALLLGTATAGGRARLREDEGTPGSSSSGGGEAPAAKHSRREAAGLDLQALAAEVARERAATAQAQRRSATTAAVLSAQEAQWMAHQVLDYVLLHQLGGRNNAAKEPEPPLVPPPGALAAERATLAPAAALQTSYVALGGGGPPVSTAQRAPLPEAVLRHRQSLRVASLSTDLVGGYGAGRLAPRLRLHFTALIGAALEGRRWTREDAEAVGSATAASAADAQPVALDLFGGETAAVPSGAADEGGDEEEGKGERFSINDFLGGDSDSD